MLPEYMSVHVHLSVWCPQKPEEGISLPGTEVTDGCKLLHRCWELIPGRIGAGNQTQVHIGVGNQTQVHIGAVKNPGLYRCCESNPGPELLTADLSLQDLFDYFKMDLKEKNEDITLLGAG